MPFVEIPDMRFYYEEAGQGIPIILAHGGWSDISAFEPQVGPISERYRLIRYDRRGCGRSEPKDVPQAADLWVEDHRHLMEVISLESAIVGGVSFGGMITIELLVKHPQILKGAIIVSATANGYQGEPGYDVSFPRRLEELEQVQVPALVVQGASDDIFPVSHGESIAKAIPNAELVVEGGHSINEEAPEAFNNAVLD